MKYILIKDISFNNQTINDLTLVTGYIQLYSKHGDEEFYKQKMESILSYNGPMVIFIDECFKEDVIKIRKNLPTKICLTKLEDLYSFKYYGKFNIEKGPYNNEYKYFDQHNYAIVNLEKINYLKEATRYFNTKYYIWLDFGYIRTSEKFPTNWPNKEKLYKIPTDKFTMLVGPYSKENEWCTGGYGKGVSGYEGCSHNILIPGGTMIGTKSSIYKYHSIFFKKLDEIIQRGDYAGYDQMIHSECYCENKKLFNLKKKKKYKGSITGNDWWFSGIPYLY